MNDQLEAPPASILSSILGGTQPVTVNPPPGAVYRHSMDKPRNGGLSHTAPAVQGRSIPKPRDFTSADKALIRKVHGYMAPLQLLGILNERLVCDIGHDAQLYTIDQLKAEISSVSSAVPTAGNDWGSLRKLLARARRDGVLAQINEQVINDFAVIFSLNQKQMLTLKDILLQQQEDEES